MFELLCNAQNQLSQLATGTLSFGATQINKNNVGENWVRENECGCMATPMSDAGDNQGMFNRYASISANWVDTTRFDTIRGPAPPIQGKRMAGTVEDMTLGFTFHSNTDYDADAAAAAAASSMGRPHIGVSAQSVLYMME
mmetsp:Transcript_34415/g.77607  ORF Transcript_34415/g.77607 Transcript_34415/m.77607 type:complete len:140 (-) Transcript_34415:847-1266(-)